MYVKTIALQQVGNILHVTVDNMQRYQTTRFQYEMKIEAKRDLSRMCLLLFPLVDQSLDDGRYLT